MGYKVCDDPLTVKLKFEPTGKLKYYLTLKENICVVCGKDGAFLRKSIGVPREYRKHYPEDMQNNRQGPVVLMVTSLETILAHYIIGTLSLSIIFSAQVVTRSIAYMTLYIESTWLESMAQNQKQRSRKTLS